MTVTPRRLGGVPLHVHRRQARQLARAIAQLPAG
jgi:hypothetical protein